MAQLIRFVTTDGETVEGRTFGEVASALRAGSRTSAATLDSWMREAAARAWATGVAVRHNDPEVFVIDLLAASLIRPVIAPAERERVAAMLRLDFEYEVEKRGLLWAVSLLRPAEVARYARAQVEAQRVFDEARRSAEWRKRQRPWLYRYSDPVREATRAAGPIYRKILTREAYAILSTRKPQD
jgi:hypothetical protein